MEQQLAPTAAAPRAWLVDPEGERVALVGEQLTCGRARENDLVLADESVSRRHARLDWRGDSYAVVDLGSANGTRVNEADLPAGGSHLLQDGDSLTIGPFTFTYRPAERAASIERQSMPSAARPVKAQRTQALLAVMPEIEGEGALTFARVRAGGVLNIETVETVLDACRWAVQENATHIVLDATKVDYIDSAAIASLVGLQRDLAELGGGLAIVAPFANLRDLPTGSVRKIVEMLHLSTFLKLYPDESQALAALGVGTPLSESELPEAAE
jgi:anti-anti-sigma factor